MAEGGVGSEEQGHSSTSGSEFVFDFYCELCRDDGLNVEAEGFCVDCKEYLCKTCIHAHRKSRPTRHHDLLDQDSMPKDTPLSHDRVSKDISTKCKLHSSKTVEFYCTSHDTLGCSTCFATVHRNCAHVESVYEKSENILSSQEYKDFAKNLQNMQERSRDMIAKTRENVSTTERSYSEAINEIRKLREEFIAIFDELEQILVTQVEDITSDDMEKMERLEKELIEFSKAVEKLRSEVEDLTNSKRVCQLYIHMREKKSALLSLKGNLRKAEERNDVRMLVFEPNNDIKNAVKATGLGKIVFPNCQSGETGEAYAENNRDVKDRTAAYVSDIDISTRSDTGRYYLIGSAVLSDTRLVITDHFNKKVKLIDTGTNKLISELTVQDYPFDIARINENQAAVSLYNDKKILLLNVTDQLSVDREISVQGGCQGVAYSQNKLLVTFQDNPHLEIMDFQGNVSKIIEYGSDGKKIFSCARHVCVSENGDNIYVSDTVAKKVFCLSFDGVVKSAYSGLSNLQKVCTDQRGHVYVAGHDSKVVHMISADCIKVKEILTQADGLVKRVLSVSYCQGRNRLYVGMNSKPVKVYQLS